MLSATELANPGGPSAITYIAKGMHWKVFSLKIVSITKTEFTRFLDLSDNIMIIMEEASSLSRKEGEQRILLKM